MFVIQNYENFVQKKQIRNIIQQPNLHLNLFNVIHVP